MPCQAPRRDGPLDGPPGESSVGPAAQTPIAIAWHHDDIEAQVGEDPKDRVHPDAAITSLERGEGAEPQSETLGGLCLTAYATGALGADDVAEV